ncbi:MAG: hypothetical protein ACHQC8_02840 [Solirubrobacterales bacterium]
MHRIRITGVVILAALAFGVVGVASASAHEFIAKPVKGKVEGVQRANHVFTTNAGKVSCTKVSSSGEVMEEISKVTKETVKYSGCLAFGFEAKVSEVKFEFNAEGTVKLENTITIEVPEAGCHVTIPPTGNEKLGTISYANKGATELEVTAAAKNIHYEASGGPCGAKAKETNGEYSGKSAVKVKEGSIQFK